MNKFILSILVLLIGSLVLNRLAYSDYVTTSCFSKQKSNSYEKQKELIRKDCNIVLKKTLGLEIFEIDLKIDKDDIFKRYFLVKIGNQKTGFSTLKINIREIDSFCLHGFKKCRLTCGGEYLIKEFQCNNNKKSCQCKDLS